MLAAPTADHERISETLGLLQADSGTAIGTGLVTATRLAQSSLTRDGVFRVPGRNLPAAIVLLSDGKQNQGRVKPLEAAALAKAAGIPVDTVALGTKKGVLGYGPYAPKVAPDPPLMNAIAKAHGRPHRDRDRQPAARDLLPAGRKQLRPRDRDSRHQRLVRRRRGAAALRRRRARPCLGRGVLLALEVA